MSQALRKLAPSRRVRHRGVTLIGYGLIVALLSLAALGATTKTGRILADCVFPSIDAALNGEGFTCVQVPGDDGSGGPGDDSGGSGDPDDSGGSGIPDDSDDTGGPGEPGDGDDSDEPRIAFTPVHGAEPDELVISLPATAENFTGSLAASVTGPEGSYPSFSIDGGEWLETAEVEAGSSIRLRTTAPSVFNETITVVFELGDITAEWPVTTGDVDESLGPQWLIGPILPDGHPTLDYPLEIEAQADAESSIAFYEFVSGELPPGLIYDDGASALSGEPEALGNYSFTLAVEDEHGRRNERTFVLDVVEAPLLASEVPPNNITYIPTDGYFCCGSGTGARVLGTQALFDPSEDSYWEASTIGTTDPNVLDIEFRTPVLMDKIHWSTNSTRMAYMEALVDGSWQRVHDMVYKSRGYTVPPEGRVVSDRFRIVSERDFYTLHFGTPNPYPEWFTPSSTLAVLGIKQSVQLGAVSESPWNPTLTYELAPGSTLPAGVTLSSNGLLDIDPSATVDAHFDFKVRLYDGVGFYDDRTFSLVPNGPMASSIEPNRISMSSGSQDPDEIRQSMLSDGGTGPGAYDTLHVVFPEVVILDQFFYEGDYGRRNVSAKIDGEWRQLDVDLYSGGHYSFHPSLPEFVASDEFRVWGDMTLETFRFGPNNPFPEWVTPRGNIAILDGAKTIQLEASSDSPWDPTLTFTIAPGSTLPAGVELTPSGELQISGSASISRMHDFTARVTDGMGFWRDLTFRLLPGVEYASEVSPDRITVVTDAAVQGAPDARMALLDGNRASQIVAVQGSATVTHFTFDEVVLLDQLHYVGKSGTKYISAWVDGGWTGAGSWTFVEGTKEISFDNMVASDRFRLTATRTFDFHFGEGNPSPEWITPAGVVATADGAYGSVQLEASSTSPWDPNLTYQVASWGLPSGVTVSEDGLLEIAAGVQVAQDTDFTVRVTDGVGFYADRVFTLKAN